MDRLDTALKKIKKKKMNEAAPLAVIGKAALVAGKALAKGAAVAGKAGAKAAKVGAKAGAKAGAKGAKAGGKAVKSGTKVVNPKVMGGEVKKSAQVAKNVKPKSGPTIDVKARRVGGDLVKTNKPTGSSTQPKVSNSGKKTVDPKKNDVTQKIKDQVKDQASNQNKPQDQNKPEDKKDDNVDKGDKKTDTKKKNLGVKKKVADTVGGISGAFGKSSFSVTESKKTFAQFVDEAVPDEYEEELDEYAMAIPAIKYGIPAAITATGLIGTFLQSRKNTSPGQMKLPGFEGSKKKDSSWGHNVVDKTREFFKNRRTAAKERKVNQALSDRARAIENAKRKQRGEGEVNATDF